MFRWFFDLFKKENDAPLICGGVGEIEVCGRFGKKVGTIFYNRPDYNDKLAFELNFDQVKIEKSSLKKISESPDVIINTHNEISETVYIPYAEKIFVKSEGFYDEFGKCIDKLSKDKQFKLLKKYYKNSLIEMVEIVYRVNTTSKKKS